MPRIDPLQLLKCLSVLLSSEGGIKSRDEVHRLASLMTKFSKKLVSKCIYVQILRTTDMELLGMFMGAGGWNLAHQWLSDAILAQNLPFIKELLELLIMCPVDVERLKANNFPKLIKNLTKEASNENVRQLACRLVDQWLRVVKGLPAAPALATNIDLMPVQTSILIAPSLQGETATHESYEFTEAVEPCVPLLEQGADYEDGLLQESVDIGELILPEVESEMVDDDETDSKISEEDTSALDGSVDTLPVYRITIRDGKQVLAKVNSSDRAPRKQTFTSATLKQDTPRISTNIVPKHSADSLSRKKVTDNTSSTKPKSGKSDIIVDVKKITKDIQKKLHEKSLTEKKMKLIEPSKEKPSDAMTEKERARERRERDLNKLKEKRGEKTITLAEKIAAQAEKDKATLAKLVPPPISKLGKIPKKARTDDDSKSVEGKRLGSDDKKSSEPKKSPQSNDNKKPSSTSSDNRKTSSSTHGRPKTVKSFNSKFRSTGLEEDIKLPSKTSRRPSSSTSILDKKSSKPDLKRSSPTKEGAPPEKKLKVVESIPEDVKEAKKPAATKPKRLLLLESDMFMDALTASTKIEPRKRKRRISASKDGIEVKKEPGMKDATPPGSPNTSEDNLSPIVMKTAPKFYRDTLESTEDENEEKTKVVVKLEQDPDAIENDKTTSLTSLPEKDSEVAIDNEKPKVTTDGEGKGIGPEVSKDISITSLKGVLVIHKSKKGPKKSVRWKVEVELESIKYFELDETERVNVTKTFTDMKQMERTTEREGFQLSRKLAQEDNMEEKTMWKQPVLIDIPPSIVQFGEKSKEKDIQYARESAVLSALYFNRSSIPDSAAEPDVEMHAAKDPIVIPLDDTTGNPEGVVDFRGKSWPEPKPMLPPTSPTVNMFQQPPGPYMPFPGSNPGFSNVGPMFPPNNMGPGIMVPNGAGPVPMGGDWRTGDGRIVAMDNSASMEMYNQQGGPAMGMGMPGVMGPGPVGPMDMNYSMMPNDEMSQYSMQGFPMQGPPMQGPPMQGGHMFPPFRGPMGPNMRGRNNGGPRGQWFRPNGAMNGSWQGQVRGGGRPWPRGVCHQFASRGSCRQGSKCTYSH